MSRAADFHTQYTVKVRGEYQWAKFEHARQKSAPARRQDRESPPGGGSEDGGARNGHETVEVPALERSAAPDLEEEMQVRGASSSSTHCVHTTYFAGRGVYITGHRFRRQIKDR